MIAFHKFKDSSLRLLLTLQIWIRSGESSGTWGGGGILLESTIRASVRSCPSVSPGRTQRLNWTRWRVQIWRSNRLHLSRYSAGEVMLGRVRDVHVPERQPSVLRVAPLLLLLWLLSPISISAVSLKPSCIMHHLWLCGEMVVGLWNSSRPSPQWVD